MTSDQETEPGIEITKEVPIVDVGEFEAPSTDNERDLEEYEGLVTLISKGNEIVMITPEFRYTINLSLQGKGVVGKVRGISGIQNYFVERETALKEAERMGYEHHEGGDD